MSKILVLGAGGMLGHKLCQRLPRHRVMGMVRGSAEALRQAFPEIYEEVPLIGGVDVLDGDRLEQAVADSRAGLVVNCVGIVKQLDEAHDPYLSVAVNSLLPHRLARLCGRIGARLIHISTDCVFDGRRGAYRESDPSDARDLYGRSKALGETTAAQPAVTLRTSFVGRELKARSHGLVEWLLAHDGGSVDGFAGVIYSGLTSLELADVIGRLIEAGPPLSGVHHVASQPISKYDLLLLIREAYGLDVDIRRAEEPINDRSLVMKSFSEATGYTAPPWPEMVRRMSQDATPYAAWRSKGETEA